jgi:hypothetical protein
MNTTPSKVYIVQIDMGEGDQVWWENSAPAYTNRDQAEQQLTWMGSHYGIDAHQLRIETLELA